MITIIIIVITVGLSLYALRNDKVMDYCIFTPTAITNRKEWHRFFTNGFIHADEIHLAFNMYSFYMFGNMLETFFESPAFNGYGKYLYIILYVSSLFFCLIPTYIKHKNNYLYRGLGASGAVSAVIFASIFIEPLQGIGLIIIPGIYFPAFIFGFIYLGITFYLDKKGNSFINHSAHFWGSIYGIVFVAFVTYMFTGNNAFELFVKQVLNYFN